jgi:hypothetical protein
MINPTSSSLPTKLYSISQLRSHNHDVNRWISSKKNFKSSGLTNGVIPIEISVNILKRQLRQ